MCSEKLSKFQISMTNQSHETGFNENKKKVSVERLPIIQFRYIYIFTWAAVISSFAIDDFIFEAFGNLKGDNWKNWWAWRKCRRQKII